MSVASLRRRGEITAKAVRSSASGGPRRGSPTPTGDRATDRIARALDALAARGEAITYDSIGMESGARDVTIRSALPVLKRAGWRWGPVVARPATAGPEPTPAEIAERADAVRRAALEATRGARPHSLLRSHAPEPVPRTEAESARLACRAMVREARRKGWLGKARRAS